jgi:hypothetical protein
MGRPKRKQQQTKAARASLTQQQVEDTNSDENDENESLNEEESSIINNQVTNLPISAAPAADLLQSQEIQFPGTNNDMVTSQNDINDANTVNNDLTNEQPNLLVLPILANQNLSLSAASAAALPLPQDIQSTVTNDAMCTSQDNIYDANYDLFNQRQNLLLLSNSNTVNVLGMAPQFCF